MYIVTGGAGFIGSNIVKGLNENGITDILVVDDLTESDKFRNLVGLRFTEYMDKEEFYGNVGRFSGIEGIFHQGACSDTTERDGRYMMETNYTCSRLLADLCLRESIPFIYASSASVYGNGKYGFRESFECEHPINVYAYSKYLFDQWARRHFADAGAVFVGLRYFNVYGPNESHKGRMASMVMHGFNQLKENGRIRLFMGCDGAEDGGQQRDFVFVDDVVSAALHFGLNKSAPHKTGIFNVGTGIPRSFKDLALSVIEAYGEGGEIEYIPFPDDLRGRYQNFTRADLTALRAAGYDLPFASLEAGVGSYISSLKGNPA